MAEEKDNEEEFNLSDFDYVLSALAYANYEGLTLEEFTTTIELAENGEQFDAGIVALIRLKELTDGTEPF